MRARRRWVVGAIACACAGFGASVVVAPRARAWEAETTHAGLTEQAALASKTHAWLQTALGRRQGWYETVTVPRVEAVALYQKLANLEPSTGAVPDNRGNLTTLGWLVAGSILEDLPPQRGRNHFFDPIHHTGLTGEGTHGWFTATGPKLLGSLLGERLPDHGVAAPDWILAKENDLGLTRFWRELELAATAPEGAARDLHLALALICAGAMAHVLQDMGSPSRTRDDLAAHLESLGAGPSDRGSRFERLAGVLHGSLGVPAPAQVEHRQRLRDFFTAADGKGLADLTNTGFYSAGTLPAERILEIDQKPAEVLADVTRSQRFASPRPKEMTLRAAAGPDGATIRDSKGTCLASYRVDGRQLSFSIPDQCALEQLAVILPRVSGYTAGLLDWLFRGALSVEADVDTISVTAVGEKLGGGKVTLLGENAQGKRLVLGSAAATGGEALGRFTVETRGMVKVIAVFHGVDSAGEEVVAVGTKTLGH
jgi:hypothetical protein